MREIRVGIFTTRVACLRTSLQTRPGTSLTALP